MQYIHGRHNGEAAIIPISIVDAAKYHEHKQSRKPILKAGLKRFRALIDTGASSTMIAAHVATELNLEPVGSKQVHGLGGSVWVMTYLFHVGFLDADFKSPLHINDGDQHALENQENKVNRYHIYTQPIEGGEMRDSITFDVLLGMDVISTGDLEFRKDGAFSFRY